MIRKTILIFIAILLLIIPYLRADEGMWIPLFLNKYNIQEMQKKGFKLTAEDIYSINKASMKDAVMIFGGGCTAELISNQGLIITNHHCGYGSIQNHSSLEHDYLTDGFWAMSNDEELPNEGLTVTFLVRMEDVTQDAMKGVTETMTDEERELIIKENSDQLIKAASAENNYKVTVKSFFYGNQYFLFVEKVYKDVRLVGSPPSAIGKFGGDTDNWMWPRHTGDFSLFRIYADQTNEPAEYSPDNVPFKPAKYFPISIKGVDKGDFTLVFGYPGRTEEYLTSYGVDMIKNKINPKRIEIRQNIIDILSKDMESNPEVRIQYASKYAGISNYWKKWIGENRGLDILDAVTKKQELENKLTEWIDENPDRQIKYGHLLPDYKRLYESYAPYCLAEEYFYEAIWEMESVVLTSKISSFLKKGSAYTEKDLEVLKKYAEKFFKDYNLETDKKLFNKLLKLYYKNAGDNFQPEIMKITDIFKDFNFSEDEIFDYYTDYYFENTFYLNQEKFNEFIEKYSFGSETEQRIKETPGYLFFIDFINVYYTKILPLAEKYSDQIEKQSRLYMQLLMEADTSKVFYPDANFTLRVTYGQVDTYEAVDGVEYLYYTTLKGVMEKDNPDIYDYKVPEKLKELYNNKDYGRYGENGEMHVCFIASNHTTGGNSGSPVINANGELIGINFDRNWEGTMSDIMYNPDQCRNISLDIRYVLFLIEKYAGAKHLINEMTILE
jgi:hypothetical protein